MGDRTRRGARFDQGTLDPIGEAGCAMLSSTSIATSGSCGAGAAAAVTVGPTSEDAWSLPPPEVAASPTCSPGLSRDELEKSPNREFVAAAADDRGCSTTFPPRPLGIGGASPKLRRGSQMQGV